MIIVVSREGNVIKDENSEERWECGKWGSLCDEGWIFKLDIVAKGVKGGGGLLLMNQ